MSIGALIIVILFGLVGILSVTIATKSGMSYVKVSSCEQVGNDIKISRNDGKKYTLTSAIRNAGHGLRDYKLNCVSETKYKVEWTEIEASAPTDVPSDTQAPENYGIKQKSNSAADETCTAGACIKKYLKKIGNADVVAVCEENCPISEKLLKKSYEGAKKAYNKLKLLTGADLEQKLKPVHVHLMSDGLCGTAEEMKKELGFVTGFATTEKTGEGAVCSFSYEKDNMILPFNEQNAARIQANILIVHEMVHLLFRQTAASYDLQENFAKAISFRISGFWDGDGTKDEDFSFVTSACDERYKGFSELNYWLCQQHGFDFAQYKLLFKEIKKDCDLGKCPADKDIKKYIDKITDEDTGDSFAKVGINI